MFEDWISNVWGRNKVDAEVDGLQEEGFKSILEHRLLKYQIHVHDIDDS